MTVLAVQVCMHRLVVVQYVSYGLECLHPGRSALQYSFLQRCAYKWRTVQPLYGGDMQGLGCLETRNKRNRNSGSRLLNLPLPKINYNMNAYSSTVVVDTRTAT